MPRQRLRLWTRGAFFALFVLAPPLDLLRLDLTLGHFILFGHPWTLGLDPFLAGAASPLAAAWNLVTRGFLPIALVAGVLAWAAWRYGRVYCGWLCPHFSVVESINGLMRRAVGRLSLWDREPAAPLRPDGSAYPRRGAYRWLTALAVLGFALLWSVTLLTYLLPPAEVYRNLVTLSPTRNQALFLSVATVLFCLEFLLARHLFCRYGCAVGLFQSFVWIANPDARAVTLDRNRAHQCVDCFAACDDVCPMRLKPRVIKRRMFACTQCAQCLDACQQVQAGRHRPPPLEWVEGDTARTADKPARLFAGER
jgi:polyferredoxin